MTAMILDANLEERLIEQRRAWGADKFDEVWKGIYLIAPLLNNKHQELAVNFCAILMELMGWKRLANIRAGVNLAVRTGDWTKDYRCPDVAVFLCDTKAENCDSHWRGPADFLIEITSPGDRTHEKIAFYDRIGVEELLIVNREDWILEFYQRQDGRLQQTAESRLPDGNMLNSRKVPLNFRLLPGEKRPAIEVKHTAGEQQWLL
jgi:Uma2 family endonuclease